MKEESNNPTRLMKVKDAAKYLALSEKTLFNFEQEGKLPVVRFGRTVRYAIEDLDAFIQSCRSGPTPAPTEKPKTSGPMPMIKRSYPNHCINCIYWFEKAEQTSSDRIGYCKRFPPCHATFVDNKPLMWNFYTGHDNWCGEFKPV